MLQKGDTVFSRDHIYSPGHLFSLSCLKRYDDILGHKQVTLGLVSARNHQWPSSAVDYGCLVALLHSALQLEGALPWQSHQMSQGLFLEAPLSAVCALKSTGRGRRGNYCFRQLCSLSH